MNLECFARWLNRFMHGMASVWMLVFSVLCADLLWRTITGSDYAKSLSWWQMLGIQIGLVVGMLALGAMAWDFWAKTRK